MSNETHKKLPLLPLRGLLVYPTMVLHLDVGREKSVQALEKCMVDESIIFLATQKEISTDEPGKEDIFSIGTLAKVNQMLKLPNGTIRVLVEGLQRGEITEFTELEKHIEVEVKLIEETHEASIEEQALMRNVLEQFEQYIQLSKKISQETFAT